MTLKRKILAMTGIRSEYGIISPVLEAIRAHPALELEVFVTGAHCADSLGSTGDLIEKDGFVVADRVESLLNSNTLAGRARSLAIEMLGLTQTMARARPDFLLVAGDREESIAAALCGAYMNTPTAHLCGGDVAVGNVDDSVRHAVSKLAHIHFPMSKRSAERLERMGEQPWRIHLAGNPALDRLIATPSLSTAELGQRLGMDLARRPLLVVLQHVLSSEVDAAFAQMSTTLDAVAELGHQSVVIYPNSDAGSLGIIKAIEKKLPSMPNTRSFRNLPQAEFVNLMRSADVLIGNSSMGVLEAPTLKLPVVNIGNRQKSREHADNIIFVQHDVKEICGAVNRALTDPEFRRQVEELKSPFGDGHAAPRIANILAETEITDALINKEFIG